MTKDISQSLANVSDEELKNKVETGYFSDEVLPQALKETKVRGISVQSVSPEFETPPVPPFDKRHPIITLALLGLLVKAATALWKEYRFTHSEANHTSSGQR